MPLFCIIFNAPSFSISTIWPVITSPPLFIKSGGEVITGQIVDIENDGALKIMQNNGIHEILISGEVSQQKTNFDAT